MRVVFVIAFSVLRASPVLPQSAAAHEEHHPPGAAARPAPVAIAPAESGMRGMKMMMSAPALDAYPNLMNFPRLSPEERRRLDRDSEARMLEGTALMSAAMNRVVGASRRGDYGDMHGALGDLRAGLGRLEAGLAGKSALDSAVDQPAVALSWLRSEMSVGAAAQTGGIVRPLSPFHAAVVVILAAFAMTMAALYIAKMRRIEALAAQWSSSSSEPAAVVRDR